MGEEKDKDLYVEISRQAKNSIAAEICISKISGVHWDTCSGGYHVKSGNYQLYGYIDYRLATELGLTSGQHDFDDNEAKIYIGPSNKTDQQYKDGYRALCEDAGQKPKSICKSNRPEGGKPCTKRILEVVHEFGRITRKELVKKLDEEGYRHQSVLNALSRCIYNNRIVTEGSNRSCNQILSDAQK